ncbi:LysM peptidoglycan-binding domain-containing protein [Neobacillus drentensis]|uniref:LysM peptidoglycan-binding domain-containing protein n=1 Tax=Neobacillus drentensis TaxID=220684 RepID=UPI002FFF5561
MKKVFVPLVSFALFLFINLSPVAAAVVDFRNIYDVKSGDTLWGISVRYGTTIDELKITNGLPSDLLIVGQKLWVPPVYEVVSGDTLWGISTAFNSTVQQIKSANGLASDLIQIGQNLKIPQKRLSMQGQYVLMTRDEFKDWLFHNQFTRKIGKIQEHHTYQPAYKDFNGTNHFALLKGMEEYHVTEMKWKTISQNLTTFPDGKVAVCRPINMAPEGSFAFNDPIVREAIEADSLTIENVGNFDKGGDVMTDAQKETIVTVAALLSMRFGLAPSIDTITYHHWWDMVTGERVLDNSAGHAVKTCPGTTQFFGGNSTDSARTNFYPLVRQKMEALRK